MRKLLALALAAVMLLCLVPGALAYEDMGQDYDAWLEKWKTENSELVKSILKDEPPLWEDYGYGSKEEMLADFGISAVEYNDMLLYDRAWDKYYSSYYEEQYKSWIADTREELGGTRTGLGVMLDESYISFPDAQPELTNGRTMIPMRALMEAMGAEVSYLDGGNVTCLLNGTLLSFKVGEKEVTAEKDGKKSTVSMDCASYIKDSRTYVPIRFFSEAAGYDVIWDSDFETAVVLDRNAIIEEIDKNFTVINRALAAGERAGKYRSALDVSAVITAFSTLDGNTTSTVRGSITVVSDGKAQHVSAALDIYGLLEIAGKALDTDLMERLTPEEIASLRSVTFEMIVNSDAGLTYIRCPMLLEMLGAGNPDAWLESETNAADSLLESETYDVYGGLTDSGLFAFAKAGATCGETVYETAVENAKSFGNAVFAYESIMEEASRAAAVLGDGAFVSSGGAYTMTFDRNDYEMLVYGQLPEEDIYDYKEMDIRLTVSETGGVSGSFAVRETGGDIRYSGTFSLLPYSLSLNMEVHVDNTMKVQLTVNSSAQPTSESIPTAPPAGSTVITADDLSLDIVGSIGIGG